MNAAPEPLPARNIDVGTVSSALDEATLVVAIQDAERRISDGEAKRLELDRSISAAREEKRLLERLLEIRRKGAVETDPIAEGNPAGDPLKSERAAHPAVDSVVAELESAGRPIHISELVRLLKTCDVEIPGAGTQANLISHLRRDPRLMRSSRGMYGLTSWGLSFFHSTSRRIPSVPREYCCSRGLPFEEIASDLRVGTLEGTRVSRECFVFDSKSPRLHRRPLQVSA